MCIHILSNSFLAGNNFPLDAYCLQTTGLPPFFYIWSSHKPIKEEQFTKYAKKKKLKQRR